MALLALQALLGLLALLAAGFGCGAWIAKALPDRTSGVERFAFRMLGGLGLFSLALFLVGQVSFTQTTIVSALIAGCLLAIRPLWLARQNRDSFHLGIRKEILLPALVVLFVLVITAVAGTAEITGDWNQDTVAYHLLGPRVWLRAGVIRPVLDNSPTAFPQIPETLFAVLLAIGGERAPDFSSWLTLGLLLFVSAGLAMRLGLESRYAWWVAAIVASMPAVYSGSHACFVDGLYASLVLAAARVGFDAQRPREWATFGMFCGLAMGTKYTGLLAFPALISCCILLLFGSTRPGWGKSIKNLSVALFTACAFASPFYIRNWILLGCPIYPPPPHYLLFCNPKYLSQQAIKQFHSYILQRGAGLGRGWLPFFKLPFNLTYHTSNFHGAGGIGLCPLGLAPVGIVAMRRSIFARLLALLTFLLVCAWYLTQQESRFLIPVYVIAAVFSVAGWKHIEARFGELQRWTAATLVGISISYGLYMIAGVQSENLRAALSPKYAELKRQRDIPSLFSFEYLNRDPFAKNVLILDRSVPPYYLQKSYVKPVGQWGELTVAGASTSLAVLPRAHELGISHVLDVISPVSGFQIQNPSPDLTLEFQSSDQRIYRVN
jgi:hypothetical protein